MMCFFWSWCACMCVYVCPCVWVRTYVSVCVYLYMLQNENLCISLVFVKMHTFHNGILKLWILSLVCFDQVFDHLVLCIKQQILCFTDFCIVLQGLYLNSLCLNLFFPCTAGLGLFLFFSNQPCTPGCSRGISGFSVKSPVASTLMS